MTVHAEPLKVTSPTLHATIFFTIAVFAALVAMSFIFKVEVVARGVGRVVPVDRVQVVQTEFGGRITAITARNGMSVKEGEVLIELDATEALAALGTIVAEQDRLLIEMARVDATAQALDLDVARVDVLKRAEDHFKVSEGLTNHPAVSEQRDLLRAQVADYLATLAQIAAREEANRRSEAVTNASIDRVKAALEIQTLRLRAAEKLLQQGATSRAAFLNVQQAHIELERETEIFLRELEQKEAERSALDAERIRVRADLRRSLLDRKAQIDGRLAVLSEERRSAERKVTSAVLTAPTAGVVDRLSVFTIGGVAEPGAELLRIVPTLAALEVEGAFSNQDIGFMQVGQRANIRLDAYPAERFGHVEGVVSDIAADSTEGAGGEWGYLARVRPDDLTIRAGEETFALRPGMTATIDVTTDTRRIISYFFAPIVRTVQNALGER